jgi:uncharacterized membrane protein
MQFTDKLFYKKLNLITFALLAVLSISGGVIALFAHNWDDFPRIVRVILSFVPVLLGIAVFVYMEMKKYPSVVWREASSVFFMFMLGSSLAMIGQVYNMGGTFADLMFNWMVLSIPIIYVANSSLAAVFYLLGIAVWVYANSLGRMFFFIPSFEAIEQNNWYWILLLAIAPHLFFNVKRNLEDPKSLVLVWAFTLSLQSCAGFTFRHHMIIGLVLIAASLYSLGRMYRSEKSVCDAWYKRPLSIVGIFGMFYILLIVSSNGFLENYVRWENYISSGSPSFMDDDFVRESSGHDWIYYLTYVVILGMAYWVFTSFMREYKENPKQMNYFNYAVAPMVLLAIVLEIMGTDTVTRILLNLFLLAWGGFYILRSVQMNLPKLAAFGFTILSLTLLVRYFDMEMSFYLKGLIYIAIGSAALYFNKVYSEMKIDGKNEE